MSEYTRRESIAAFLAAPFAWLFGKTEEKPNEYIYGIIDTANEWREQAEAEAANADEWQDKADYWETRCLAGEGDLKQCQENTILTHQHLGDYTHPDCLTDKNEQSPGRLVRLVDGGPLKPRVFNLDDEVQA